MMSTILMHSEHFLLDSSRIFVYEVCSGHIVTDHVGTQQIWPPAVWGWQAEVAVLPRLHHSTGVADQKHHLHV